MKKLYKYVPAHILLCIIIGILVEHEYAILTDSFSVFIVLFSLCLVATLLSHILKKSVLFAIFSKLIFLALGIIITYSTNSTHHKYHYSSFSYHNSSIVVKIREQLKPSKNYNRFTAEIIQIDSNKTKGKILLNIQKGDSTKSFYSKNLIIPKAKFITINLAKNPHSFDYRKYMEFQGVYHQMFLNKNFIISNRSKTFSLFDLALSSRIKIQEVLKLYNFSSDQLAIINALLLGQKQELSSDLRNNYTKAGAIHILAISGLHIGIITLLLNYLFKWLLLFKNGKIYRGILVTLLLWSFACLTGLSPSVIRATTMFTFVVIGKSISQNQPIEFSLISSMLCILLIHPMLIFNVGFQLSYLAVFGIVWIQPIFQKIWSPRNWILNKFWQLTTVSIAAQIATLPISLYYFHQIPGLFLISNFIIIPFLGLILGLGFALIFLALLDLLPNLFVTIYAEIISLMNSCVGWISSFDEYILTNINMPIYNMMIWYVIIVLLILVFQNFRPKIFIILLLSIVSIQTLYIFQKHATGVKKEFIVFHQYKSSIVGLRNNKTIKIFSNDSLKTKNTTLLKSYITNENIGVVKHEERMNYLKYKSNNILIIDSLGIYPKSRFNKLVILLQNSPKVNLKRLIKDLNPTQIIADGSNYNSYIKLWKTTCEKEKTPFHSTNDNGAYILKE